MLEEVRIYANSIFDTLREPLLVLDTSLRIVSANRSFYRIFQVTREATEGCLVYELGSHQWDIPRLREQLETIVPANAHFEDFEVDHTFPTIGHKTMLLNARRLQRKNGEPWLILLAIEDVTDRRRAEAVLARQTRELGRSNADLQEFASVAAHDLQEPLRKIQAFGDRLRGRAAAELSAEGLDYLERMQNAANRMQQLIRDLLTFARVTTKASPFQPVDLKEIVAGVLSDLEVKIQETKAGVQIGELPTIEADPTQMRQLFQNLIGNALKFQPKGQRPVVTVGSRNPDGGGKPAKMCELSVADNGIGFDERHVDRIFQVFQRLHGREEYDGTGVGLAICRKIAERHGGKIRAESRPGAGATFIVDLPIRQVTTAAPMAS